MDRHRVLTLIRIASIVAVVAAIIAPAADLLAADRFDPTRFFAYFTIQSNIVGVVTFAWLLAVGRRPHPAGLERLRGAAAVYLTVTFFVVIFLLSGVDVQLEMAWVDVVLHKVFPIIVVLDWILDPPQVRVEWRDVGIWLIYPIVWAILTVVRGAIDGWYPYPFLDPATGGYGQVAVTIAAITVGFIAVGAAIRAVGNARGSAVR